MATLDLIFMAIDSVSWTNSIISRLVSELFGHTEAFGG